MVKVCLSRRMRFVLNLKMLRKVELRMRSILNLLFVNMQLVHTFKIPHLGGIVGVILHIFRVPYLVEKGRGIPYLDRKIIKVLGFEAVSMGNSSMIF